MKKLCITATVLLMLATGMTTFAADSNAVVRKAATASILWHHPEHSRIHIGRRSCVFTDTDGDGICDYCDGEHHGGVCGRPVSAGNGDGNYGSGAGENQNVTEVPEEASEVYSDYDNPAYDGPADNNQNNDNSDYGSSDYDNSGYNNSDCYNSDYYNSGHCGSGHHGSGHHGRGHH